MAKREPIVAALQTDQGQVRDHNEDFIAAWEPNEQERSLFDGRLYILADGAGGMQAGEVASSLAVEQTLDHFRAHSEAADDGLRLYGAMCAANDALRELMAQDGAEGRMATTMVAVAVRGAGVTIANIGDSRAYHLRNGTLRQVTRDHSLVARLVEEGVITAEEALTHPRRNVIFASLGSDRQPQIELFELQLEAGDQLLLCSDGLTNHVRDGELAQILNEHEPQAAATALIELANARGGTDNISVIVIQAADGVGTASTRARVTPVAVPAANALAAERRWLWRYTALLAVLQSVLIFVAWLWLLADLY